MAFDGLSSELSMKPIGRSGAAFESAAACARRGLLTSEGDFHCCRLGIEIPGEPVVLFLRGHSGKENRATNVAELSLNRLLRAPYRNPDLAPRQPERFAEIS